MHSFDFHNPVRIVFGTDTLKRTGAELKPYGRRVLLVSGGGSIRANGVHQAVTASLREAGIEWVEFAGIRANPLLSQVREAIALGRSRQVEAVLAVGGGSVIDASKAIAGGMVDSGDVWEVALGQRAFATALPLVAVQTLPATSSEMNCGWVVTHDQTRQKLGHFDPPCFPKVSICDPTVMRSLPRAQLAYAAVDAVSHLVEGYCTAADPRTPLQNRYAEALMTTLIDAVAECQADPGDLDAASSFMWASTLAWNGLSVAGLGAIQFPNHIIEHPLSGVYDLAHGAGLALVIPAWLEHAAGQHEKRIARLARMVFAVREDDDRRAALAAAPAFRAWCARIGAPTSWAEAGVAAPDLALLAEHAEFIARSWGMPAYSAAVNRTILERIPRGAAARSASARA